VSAVRNGVAELREVNLQLRQRMRVARAGAGSGTRGGASSSPQGQDGGGYESGNTSASARSPQMDQRDVDGIDSPPAPSEAPSAALARASAPLERKRLGGFRQPPSFTTARKSAGERRTGSSAKDPSPTSRTPR
jgi:hypothetical protein